MCFRILLMAASAAYTWNTWRRWKAADLHDGLTIEQPAAQEAIKHQ